MKSFLLQVLLVISIPLTFYAQSDCIQNWRYTTIGDQPGLRTMQAEDLNGDGLPEIFINANQAVGYWYVLNAVPVSGRYRKVYTSRMYIGRSISLIRLIDIDQDGQKEIIIVDSRNGLEVYDSQTFELIRTATISLFAATNLLFVDADNDGEKEVVISNEQDVHLLNSATFSLERRLSISGRNIAVGQLDADSQLEIVNADGNVYQLVNDVLIEEWNATDISSFNNIRYLKLIQADTDPAMEFIIGYGRTLDLFDVESRSMIISNSLNSNISEMVLEDINNDGNMEVYVGTSLGSIWRLDNTLQNETRVVNPFSLNLDGICSFAVIDANNNGEVNYVIGDGCGSSAQDNIHIINEDGNAELWTTLDLEPPFTSVNYNPVNNNILAFTQSHNNGAGRRSVVVTLNPVSGRENSINTQTFFNFNVNGAIPFRFTTNEEVNHYLVYGGDSFFGAAWIVEPTNNFPIIHSLTGQSRAFRCGATADINNDGEMEVVLGHSNGITILDNNLSVIEEIEILDNFVQDVILTNLDNDPELEIVLTNGQVNIIDDNFEITWTSPYTNIKRLAVTDWDQDGDIDILTGDDRGNLRMIKTSDYSIFESFSLSNSDIHSLNIVDLNNDGVEELICSSAGRIFLIQNNNDVNELINIGIATGQGDAIDFQDIDNDDLKEIFLGDAFAVSQINGECYSSYLSTSTSISDNGLKEKKPFEVYPNPVSAVLNIKSEYNSNYRLELIDVTGKILISSEYTDQINITNLLPGCYFILFYGDEGGLLHHERIIKF